jgi:hypothetical protein
MSSAKWQEHDDIKGGKATAVCNKRDRPDNLASNAFGKDRLADLSRELPKKAGHSTVVRLPLESVVVGVSPVSQSGHQEKLRLHGLSSRELIGLKDEGEAKGGKAGGVGMESARIEVAG